jgi:hypothetical protein
MNVFFEQYVADVRAGVPYAAAIDRVCRAVDVRVTDDHRQFIIHPRMTTCFAYIGRWIGLTSEEAVIAALRMMLATCGGKAGGLLSKKLLSRWLPVFCSADFARASIERRLAFAARLDLESADVADVIAHWHKPPPAPVAQSSHEAQIIDLKARGFKPNDIAAHLRVPYAEVRRVLA